MGEELQRLGYKIETDGTDNHIVLLNLRDKEIDGGRVEHVFNALNISCNKNTLQGDLSAMKPSGLRLGSPAMTSRNCGEAEFRQIAQFLHRGVEVSQKYNTFKKLVNFKKKVNKNLEKDEEIVQLKNDVEEFSEALSFPYN